MQELPFDTEAFPFGVAAGNNKLGIKSCPGCRKGSDAELTPENNNGWPNGPLFLFRDHLSAQEYRISGLCQPCQDGVFTAG